MYICVYIQICIYHGCLQKHQKEGESVKNSKLDVTKYDDVS